MTDFLMYKSNLLNADVNIHGQYIYIYIYIYIYMYMCVCVCVCVRVCVCVCVFFGRRFS